MIPEDGALPQLHLGLDPAFFPMGCHLHIMFTDDEVVHGTFLAVDREHLYLEMLEDHRFFAVPYSQGMYKYVLRIDGPCYLRADDEGDNGRGGHGGGGGHGNDDDDDDDEGGGGEGDGGGTGAPASGGGESLLEVLRSLTATLFVFPWWGVGPHPPSVAIPLPKRAGLLTDVSLGARLGSKNSSGGAVTQT